jgi:hypothetical protein
MNAHLKKCRNLGPVIKAAVSQKRPLELSCKAQSTAIPEGIASIFNDMVGVLSCAI